MPEATNTSITIIKGADEAARTAVTPPPAPNLQQVFPLVPEAKGEMGAVRPSNEGPSRDAWLIELCSELTAIYDESDRLFEISKSTEANSPEDLASNAFDDRMWDRREELINTVFATPAMTPAGMSAKATAVFRITDVAHASDPDSRESRAARSLATDILQGVAA